MFLPDFLAPPQSPDAIKACCAFIYEHEWLQLLLGDSYHPGKLALTRRLGEMLGLQSTDRVLDVASGPGTAAIFLAQTFGCEVVGVDLAPNLVQKANQQAAEAGLVDRVRFQQGDAERLPFDDASFDVVICECAFCTFPDKETAACEFARMLRTDGRIGISDLTKSGPLPPELETLMAWVACIADARPLDGYVTILSNAGLAVRQIENHDKALYDLIQEIRGRLLGVELVVKLKNLDLPIPVDWDEAGRVAKLTAEVLREGRLGYALFTGDSLPKAFTPKKSAL